MLNPRAAASQYPVVFAALPTSGRQANIISATQGSELAPVDGHLRKGAKPPAKVFDEKAQAVHIRVQARSGKVDGEIRETIV